MRLYVANCTMQYHFLNYRLPENPSMISQQVPSLRQVQVAKDLNQPQVESFIGQLRKYGLVTLEEALNHRPRNPIVWVCSAEKPVPEDVIRRIKDLNTGIIANIGKETRRQAALATSHNMAEQAHTPKAATNFEMTIEEVGKDAGDQSDHLFGEGIAVTTEPEKVGADRRTSGRRGAGRRG
jgi:hypothetical protein